jgi:hypothetical protein
VTPFDLFWHRLGNAPDGVAAVLSAAGRGPTELPTPGGARALRHGLELDLKWAADGDGVLLYAWHGPTGRERLSASRARRWAGDGRLLLLDALLDRAADRPLLVELKCGDGPPEAALEALGVALERRCARRALVAASSLELLAAAGRVLPALPRVLFAAPLGADRVHHRPTTYTVQSLVRHGPVPRLAPGAADLLCTLGLRPRPLADHRRLADAARSRGLGYLPGRVSTRAEVEALAAEPGLDGAFVYADARRWG